MVKRLEFFEKDSMVWTDSLNLQPFYKSLVDLKKKNKAFWAGDEGGFPISIESNEDVIGFYREVENSKVIAIFNFTSEEQSVEITSNKVHGSFTDYFTNKAVKIDDNPLSLKPWEFMVFVK